MKNILTNLMTSAVLVTGIAGISPALHAADNPDTVSKLLADARARSSQLSADWKTYTKQPNLNWTSDGAEITHLKEDVSAASKTVSDLRDARNQASPSEAAAIDRIEPVMEEIAENTANAIKFLSGNQSRISGKEYKEYIDASTDTSARLAGLISQIVEYSNHKIKFDAAKRTLELASK